MLSSVSQSVSAVLTRTGFCMLCCSVCLSLPLSLSPSLCLCLHSFLRHFLGCLPHVFSLDADSVSLPLWESKKKFSVSFFPSLFSFLPPIPLSIYCPSLSLRFLSFLLFLSFFLSIVLLCFRFLLVSFHFISVFFTLLIRLHFSHSPAHRHRCLPFVLLRPYCNHTTFLPIDLRPILLNVLPKRNTNLTPHLPPFVFVLLRTPHCLCCLTLTETSPHHFVFVC